MTNAYSKSTFRVINSLNHMAQAGAILSCSVIGDTKRLSLDYSKLKGSTHALRWKPEDGGKFVCLPITPFPNYCLSPNYFDDLPLVDSLFSHLGRVAHSLKDVFGQDRNLSLVDDVLGKFTPVLVSGSSLRREAQMVSLIVNHPAWELVGLPKPRCFVTPGDTRKSDYLGLVDDHECSFIVMKNGKSHMCGNLWRLVSLSASAGIEDHIIEPDQNCRIVTDCLFDKFFAFPRKRRSKSG